MKIKYICILFFLTFFFCKKEPKEKIILDTQNFFSEITDISNFEEFQRMKLNDSTYEISGKTHFLQVTGHLTQNNEKIDWWKVSDTKSNKEIATIEYRIVNDKEFANQYKFLNNSQLDIYKSKYYTLKSKKFDIVYSFYVPKSTDIINSKGKFLYFVYDAKKNKEVSKGDFECTNSDNEYRCEFSIPKNIDKIVISGVFREISQIKDGSIGESKIYVRDSINIVN